MQNVLLQFNWDTARNNFSIEIIDENMQKHLFK